MHLVSYTFHHLLVVVESKVAFTSSGEMMRVPGILAGLKERSQSAYAAPEPKPVDSATGHVRRRKKMTDATTPTPKPTPALTRRSAKQRSYF